MYKTFSNISFIVSSLLSNAAVFTTLKKGNSAL